jgi:long-chain acyl-CoA synthetase
VPAKLLRLIREHRPTIFVAIPSMYTALLHLKDAKPEDFASMRFIVSGGEPLPRATFDGFRDRFHITLNEGYGLTETSPVTNWCRPEEFRLGSVGKALPRLEQRVVDPHSNLGVGPDVDGEVQMRGPNIMRGYFRLPEETARAFTPDGFFRSGDMGRMSADGHLFITGRIKEMLIVGGENVFPREIEEVLNRHPSVAASGVVGKQDPLRGEQPLAFVEPKEGMTCDERELLAHCRASLAGYKVPVEVRVLSQLPRNATGKIMRKELVKLVGGEG